MNNFVDFIESYPPVKRVRVNDLLLAEFQCPLSDTRYDMWSHHNYFIYVLRGRKKWFTIDQEALIGEGECLFVRKSAHSVYQYFDTDFCALILFLPDEFIRDVLHENQAKLSPPSDASSGPSLFSVRSTNQLKAYFTSFFAYLHGKTAADDRLMELKFRELLMMVTSGAADRQLSNYFAAICRSTRPSLRDVMESNYNYPMTLAQYAKLGGRSLSAFKREFKEIYGTTPGRWLMQKRLDLARHLLERTDKSISEIVLDSGFVNNSHFSRAFRERFDLAPVEWRREAADRPREIDARPSGRLLSKEVDPLSKASAMLIR